MTTFKTRHFNPPPSHEDWGGIEEVKKKSEMTPEEFYIKSQGLTEKENAPIVFYRTDDLWALMQAYAEHCEESAWVGDGSLPPMEAESTTVSIDVFTMIGESEGEMVMIKNWYDFTANSWAKCNKFVKSWRAYPQPPKQ